MRACRLSLAGSSQGRGGHWDQHRPTGRYLLTLTPKAYAGTGVQAVHPDQ
ncbi:hypothetical protein [Streptomyces collinus]